MKALAIIVITVHCIQSYGQQLALYQGQRAPSFNETMSSPATGEGIEHRTLPQPSSWTIDDQALNGFPEGYRAASLLYLQSALKLLEGNGTIPTRLFHELAPNPRRGELFQSGNYTGYFPLTVRVERSFPVNVTLRLLPEPLAIERCGFRPPDMRERAKQQRHKLPDDWRFHREGWRDFFYGTAYMIAKPEYEFSGMLRPPFPQGYEYYYMGGVPDRGYLNYHCRVVSELSFEEFVAFPAGWPEHFRSQMVYWLYGSVSSSVGK